MTFQRPHRERVEGGSPRTGVLIFGGARPEGDATDPEVSPAA